MGNIQLKTGKTLDDFWRLANEKGLVERGKVVSKHSEMLAWLKSKEIGLGQGPCKLHHTISPIAY